MEALRRNEDVFKLFEQLETLILSRAEVPAKNLQRRKTDRQVKDVLPVKPIAKTKELMNHYELDGTTFYLTPTELHTFLKSPQWSGKIVVPVLVRKGILRKAIPGPIGLKEVIKYFQEKEQVTV